jgi:enoyl-CoA hydratase/carnithine racemase
MLVSRRKVADHVALVTIERPEYRNAVNSLVTQELSRIVRDVDDDPDVRVAILTGSGNQAFCAGADLKEVAAGNLRKLFTADGGFGGFAHRRKLKPWIAAVNGPALAGGCELALAADLIVATDEATFGLPEVTRGLIASAGGLYRLPRLVPARIAAELILTGRPITAQEASQRGLINQMVEREALLDTAIALAVKIAGNAPLAVQSSLKVMSRSADCSDEHLYALGNKEQSMLAGTSDFIEGSTAFVEKRAPVWRGE